MTLPEPIMSPVSKLPLTTELSLHSRPFVVTVSRQGIKVVPKGLRVGRTLRWDDILWNDGGIAGSLSQSLREVMAFQEEPRKKKSRPSPGNTRRVKSKRLGNRDVNRRAQ